MTNLKELAAQIAEDATVDQKEAMKVLRSLFGHISTELQVCEEVRLPTLGRFVRRMAPNGQPRVLFIQPKPVEPAE
ncbi:MAG: hypothetical protein GY949_12470 [Gammaproteobacteria bacterium]|nr:hypothetical protein [Gammaproteobacteria bacterium]